MPTHDSEKPSSEGSPLERPPQGGSLHTGSQATPLDQLVAETLAGAKYRDVCPDLVRTIGARELARRRSFKEAVKSTRNKLHQVSGAYLPGRQQYARWYADLRQATQQADQAVIRDRCRSIMSHHTSTRERLPLLDIFYTTLLADLAPIHSVLDIACGLNPLAIPWMPLVEGARYYAYDIHQHLIDFLQQSMTLLGVKGHASMCDILQDCPTHEVDVALLLKALPCLEQVDKQAGKRLLQTIRARALLVSFPVHSLGGRGKGMSAHYAAHFHELVREIGWQVRFYEFATELVFVVNMTVSN
jgi:16S rRNA (guanine(1405)-N(7))-methyltransferase